MAADRVCGATFALSTNQTVRASTTVPTTITTTLPSTTSAAPVVSISDSVARQVIDAYYAAYRARDFDALRAIFPAATDLDRARIEALRKDFEPCDYNVREMEVTSVSATRASVLVQLTETCKPRIRANTGQLEASRAVELEKTVDGRWIVTRGP